MITITTGTYNTSNFRVVKEFSYPKSAKKFVLNLGYKGDVFNGLEFSSAGTTYKISIN